MTVAPNDLIDIENRNALRRQAKLPPLDILAELKRLAAVREQAKFEIEWEKRQPQFAKWIDEANGFLSKMGRYNFARQQVRKEIEKGQA
jgi:hypothetical protein